MTVDCNATSKYRWRCHHYKQLQLQAQLLMQGHTMLLSCHGVPSFLTSHPYHHLHPHQYLLQTAVASACGIYPQTLLQTVLDWHRLQKDLLSVVLKFLQVKSSVVTPQTGIGTHRLLRCNSYPPCVCSSKLRSFQGLSTNPALARCQLNRSAGSKCSLNTDHLLQTPWGKTS